MDEVTGPSDAPTFDFAEPAPRVKTSGRWPRFAVLTRGAASERRAFVGASQPSLVVVSSDSDSIAVSLRLLFADDRTRRIAGRDSVVTPPAAHIKGTGLSGQFREKLFKR
jgi:hypothetical protein